MIIGINATAAFTKPRTGVEEYVYQLIKHLAALEGAKEHRFILYHPNTNDTNYARMTRILPENFELKELKWPLPMWTQVRLASEMALNKPDVLFIPVHILPLIHPRNSVVTIQGLEHERYPEVYPKKHLVYLRWATKYASKKARKIIVPSESTKKDLTELYRVNPDKIHVIHHGVRHPMSNMQETNKYILFIGRLEKKKNIEGIISAFELLKKKYQVPHKLVLAGPRGYGYKKIRNNDIVETGYI
ncbi:MAG: glycosyltransferase, partial [Candidatus Portnoybacteria bacterium]